MDLLEIQRILKNLLQHHSSKASVLQHSAFFIVQLSHPYMTTGNTIALTRWTFVDKVMSLLFNMLSRLVIAFLPRSKHLLILWLQSPSAVILEPPKMHTYIHTIFILLVLFLWRTLTNSVRQGLLRGRCQYMIDLQISYLEYAYERKLGGS